MRFVGWMLVGLLIGLGLLAILTIGIFILPVAGALAVLLLRSQPDARGLGALMVGPAAPLFYIAALNWGGPGWSCWSTSTEQGCTELLTPWPFLAGGIAFLVGGLALEWAIRRSVASRASTSAEMSTAQPQGPGAPALPERPEV